MHADVGSNEYYYEVGSLMWEEEEKKEKHASAVFGSDDRVLAMIYDKVVLVLGDLGGDTWREGDCTLGSKRNVLDLKFVNCSII